MKTLQEFKDGLREHARDVRLNLGSVLTPEGAPGLSVEQIRLVALASAYATRSRELIDAMESETASGLSDAGREAARGAATLMAMNNVYYRSLHQMEGDPLKGMPARLRMNLLAKPGVPKADFELMSLAVSALNGCGACVNAHTHSSLEAGISKEGVQSAVRIAAVLNSAAQAVW